MLQMFGKGFFKLDKYVISTLKKKMMHSSRTLQNTFILKIKKNTRWPKIKLNARLCSLC